MRLNRHLKVFILPLALTFVPYASMYYFFGIIPMFFIWAWLIMMLPLFYTHFTYYLNERGRTIIISENVIEIKYKDNSFVVQKNDIDKIVCFVSKGYYCDGMLFFPHDHYYFLRFYLSNGDTFIITTLLSPHIEILFEIFRDKTIRFAWGLNFLNREYN
jgi:hypothetical protein